MGVKTTWKDRAREILATVQPVTRVVDRVATIAVQLQKNPTLIGGVAILGSVVNAVSDQLGNTRGPGHTIDMVISKEQLIQAVEKAGASVSVTRYADGSEQVNCRVALR